MGWFVITIMLIISPLACLLLMFVFLIQSGMGGFLSSLGSARQGLSESLGATGAEKTLNKLTTWSAVIFMVFAILISLVGSHAIRGNRTPLIIKETGKANAPVSQTVPAGPETALPGAKPGAKETPLGVIKIPAQKPAGQQPAGKPVGPEVTPHVVPGSGGTAATGPVNPPPVGQPPAAPPAPKPAAPAAPAK
jgi:protein translocase SecG subunit